MTDSTKEYFIKLFWVLAAFVTLIALVCNTVFPIVNGEPVYAVFNVLVCSLAGVLEYKKIKESGGV